MTSETPDQPAPETRRGLLARLFRKRTEPTPAAEPEPSDHDTERQPVPVHLPPGIAALVNAAALTAATSAPDRGWTPMFADEVQEGDLLGMPGGMSGQQVREFEVRKIRSYGDAEEDPLAPWLTFLLVDAASGEVVSPTVSAHQGFRVALRVPDSPAGLGGGV